MAKQLEVDRELKEQVNKTSLSSSKAITGGNIGISSDLKRKSFSYLILVIKIRRDFSHYVIDCLIVECSANIIERRLEETTSGLFLFLAKYCKEYRFFKSVGVFCQMHRRNVSSVLHSKSDSFQVIQQFEVSIAGKLCTTRHHSVFFFFVDNRERT